MSEPTQQGISTQTVLTAAVIGGLGFLASDFVQTRDNSTGDIERRLSTDIAEVKALIREQGATTRRELEGLGGRVAQLELNQAQNLGQLRDFQRRLDLQSQLIRERTLQAMEKAE